MQHRAGRVTRASLLVAGIGLLARSFAPASPPTTNTSAQTEVIDVAPVNIHDGLAHGFILTYSEGPAVCYGWPYANCFDLKTRRGGSPCWPWTQASGSAERSSFVLCMSGITRRAAVGMRTGSQATTSTVA